MVEASSGSVRRRGVSLPRIQTSFCDHSHQRLQRPRPVENIILEKTSDRDRSSEITPPVSRQSKGGLFVFFGRGRSAAAQKGCQTRDVGGIEKESIVQQQPINHSKPSQEIQGDPLANAICASRPGLNHSATSLQHRGSKGKQKPQPDRQEPVAKNLGAWDPPELFKAYPQAVRHVRLRAPILNAETILRHYEATKSLAVKENIAKTWSDQDVDVPDGQRSRTKHEEEKKAKRSSQNVWSNVSWTEKIYVLTTSGYLLRYSGSGNYDRVPEKTMSLGKRSAAFVSDAIPGQHYVLQISRVTKEDGTIHSDIPRSIFKKLGFRSGSSRLASNFLLVFDSPEEMNEWLVVLRNEIESLGGRKCLPDVPRQATEDAVKQSSEIPTRRYLIQKDPNRYIDSQPDPDAGAGEECSGMLRSGLGVHAGTLKSPASYQQRPMDSPSLSHKTASTDQLYLEQLRGTPRLSYASAGGKTLSTSWGSSPSPSPARAAFFPEEPMAKPEGQEILISESSQLSPFRTAKHPMTTSSCSLALAPDASEQRTQRRTSAYSSSSEQTASWPPPNYSVPSFSKRYSYSALTPDSQKKSLPSAHGQPEKCVDQPRNVWEGRRLSEGLNTTKPLTATNLSTLSSFSSPRGDAIALYPTTQSAIPHHFSLPACGGASTTSQPASTPVASPHPPPTTALPALPERHHERKPSLNVVDNYMKERPVSMQGHSNPNQRLRCSLPKIGLQDPSKADEYTLSSPSRTVQSSSLAPDLSRVSGMQPTLQQCKSMPQLSAGSLQSSAPGLSLLPEVPFLFKGVINVRESSAGPHRACDEPGRLVRSVEVT